MTLATSTQNLMGLGLPGPLALKLSSQMGSFQQNAGEFMYKTATAGITAHAGGGQANAVPLTSAMNRVSTVASAGDSVLLPASAVGLQITATNAAALNSMNVFPATGDAINALGANAAFAVAAGKTAIFSCSLAGQWDSVLSA